MFYPIAIHKDANTDYGVTFPDLPGCFSAGTDFADAINSAKEAAYCHIEGMLLDGECVPVANSIESHQNNPDYQAATWALVEVDLSELSLEKDRFNISAQKVYVSFIDRAAKAKNMNRSQYLIESAMDRAQKELLDA